MKTLLIGVLGALMFIPASASASSYTAPTKREVEKYSGLWHAAFNECGRCAGRNIRKWGMRTPKGRVVKPQARHFARSIRQLRLIRMPLLTGRPPSQPPSNVQTAGAPPGGVLASIAQCESGGNPSTNTGNGFFGKYQFTLSTWASVGGSGLPSNAPEAEQDMRAAMLYAREGPGPWPVCGK